MKIDFTSVQSVKSVELSITAVCPAGPEMFNAVPVAVCVKLLMRISVAPLLVTEFGIPASALISTTCPSNDIWPAKTPTEVTVGGGVTV